MKEKNINEALTNLLNTSSYDTNQYVTFKIANEDYGIEIKSVQEIIGYKQLTHIPNVHSFIKGVFNLRGNIIPIMDPRIKFGMEERVYDKLSIIVIFSTNSRTIGLLVDEVNDVLNINKEDIQETPDFSTSINTRFIKGIGKVGEKLIIILDLEKILTEEEFNHIKQIDKEQ